MKGSDKAIVLGVLMAVVLVGFYLKVLSPKREEAASLKTDITALQSQIDEEKQVVAFGEQARQEFPTFYGRLVVLGKAVPDQADTASLMVQLNTIANRAGVDFEGIELGTASDSSGSATTAPSSGAASGTPASPGTSSSSASAGTSTTPSTGDPASSSTAAPASSPAPSAPATEAGAASLPIGASVGPAGLPTMPYDLTFAGSYFDVTEFLKDVDDLVGMGRNGQVSANGRLVTIDGFALEPSTSNSASGSNLQVTLSVTSYVTPATEGLTGGASPSGPGTSVTEAATQPASQVVAQ